MKTLAIKFPVVSLITKKLLRVGITLCVLLLAAVALLRVWAFYTESPWTRDAKFSADVVAITPDVSGLLTEVLVHDNQQVKKGGCAFCGRSTSFSASTGRCGLLPGAGQ